VNVLLFGGTGMIGRAALMESLRDARVRSVLAIGRRPSGLADPKLREVVHDDLFDLSAVQPEFSACDACFYCLGGASYGMTERAYTHLTYDLALAVASSIAAVNTRIAFCFLSGEGADATERGRTMWARVKGKTENDLTKMFSRAYMFRPGYIHPEKGVRSRTGWVRAAVTVLRPVGFLLKQFPGVGTSSDVLGRAMIAAVRSGAPSHAVEIREINTLGAGKASA
jgi:uncharacterized protein YbjT (DUF2867 family)